MPNASLNDPILLNPLFQHSNVPSFHSDFLRHGRFTSNRPIKTSFLSLFKYLIDKT